MVWGGKGTSEGVVIPGGGGRRRWGEKGGCICRYHLRSLNGGGGAMESREVFTLSQVAQGGSKF